MDALWILAIYITEVKKKKSWNVKNVVAENYIEKKLNVMKKQTILTNICVYCASMLTRVLA